MMSGYLPLTDDDYDDELGEEEEIWIEPIVIDDDEQFALQLGEAENKVVLVDFPDTNSILSTQLSQQLTEYANTYRDSIVVMQVQVDKCPATVISEKIYILPTVMIYINMVAVDHVHGYHPEKVENKIKLYIESNTEKALDPGYRNLLTYIDQENSICLNESFGCELYRCLTQDKGYLKSSRHEQLILVINFTQPVKLHSVQMKAPITTGPKTIKFYINHQCTLNFHNAKVRKPDKVLRFTATNLSEGDVIPLDDSFDNARSVQLFVEDNLTGGVVTVINELVLFGSPFSSDMLERCRRQWFREREQR